MAFILADRVQETGTANTTVSFTLSGASTGFQTFAAVGNTNTTYYGATDGTNWEVGIGTYSTTGPTLTRTTILSSSNSGSAVTFASTVTVWVDYPAGKQISSDYPNALGVVVPAAGTFSSLGSTGNLAFTGTGNRITGDFSNATVASRTMFQTSTTNGVTRISGIPNGSGTGTLFTAYGLSDPTNSPTLSIFQSASASAITAAITGTGTYTPLTFSTNGSERLRIFTSGGVSIGNTTDPGATNLSVTGAINLGTPLSVSSGGTGLTSLTASRIPYGNGTSAFNSSANLTYNGTDFTLLSGDIYATNPTAAPTALSSPGKFLYSVGQIWNSGLGTRTMTGGFQVASYQANINPTVSKLSFVVGTDNAAATEKMYVTSTGLFNINGGATFAGTSLNDTFNAVYIQNNAAATNLAAQASNKLFLQGRSWNSAAGNSATNGYLQAVTVTNNANPTIESLNFAPASGSATAATQYFAMTSQGRFGIGTVTPTQTLDVTNTAGARQFTVASTASSVNYLQVTGAATTVSPSISALGSDTNINLTLNAKGTGTVTTTNLAYTGTLTGGTGVVNLGSGQFYKDASGNVGLGTTSPVSIAGYTIQTLNNGTTGSGTYYQQAGTSIGRVLVTSSQMFVGTNGAYPLLFTTNAAEAMRIDSSGNVGIGTSSPAVPLHVVTTGSTVARFTRDLATDSVFSIGADNDGTILESSGINNMRFFTSASERMRIDSSGNVGIGTSSPSGYRLNVLGSLRLGQTGIDTYIGFGANNDNYFTAGSAGVQIFRNEGTERMRIDSSGNLGVGITSVGARLQIQGVGDTGATFCTSFLNSGGFPLLDVRNDGLITTGSRGGSPYNNTTASAANMFVDSSGILYRSTSSIKYKTDVENAVHGLAEVMKLRPVTYKGKNDGDTIFGGLIAEEVDKAGLSEFVQYAEDGTPDALAYANMVALAFKAIQELNTEVQALKQQLGK